MRRRHKIAAILFLILAIPLLVVGVAISYTSACPPVPVLASGVTTMKAIVSRCYGPPEVLTYEDVAKPTPADDELLVKVRAAAVNPLDWHYMRGEPYVMRLMGAGIGAPKDQTMGVDFAGTVEAVGKNVATFKPGDEVFGTRGGAFGEYLTVRESRNVVLKPTNASFEQAAAVPVAAVTALQALRDKGRVKAGQKILINGASGGVGTYAVQIAKVLGAEVTGVCSTRNVQLVRSLGADHVIDYNNEDFTKGEKRYDVIVDNVGNHPMLRLTDALQPDGILVIVGSPSDDRWIGALIGFIKATLLAPFVSQELSRFFSSMNKEDLTLLRNLMQEGKLISVIDRTYKLSEAPAAIAYLETGRARGKVVILPD